MDSPRTWHVIFTGSCCVIAAVIPAVVTYFLTIHFTKQTVGGSSTVLSRNAEASFLQKKVADLQAALAAEQRSQREDQEQVAELENTKSAQKEKISKLELKITEMQNELDGANSRFASEQLQLKKLSSDSQNRLDRAR